MTRSVWKGPFVDGYLLKKADKSRASGRSEVIKIWSRRSTILPQFVGLTFGVYNGQKHIPVNVTEEMVGHKFGEFAPTRTFQLGVDSTKALGSMFSPAGISKYLDNFGSAGFEALGSVQSEDMDVGDVLLMQVASPVQKQMRNCT